MKKFLSAILLSSTLLATPALLAEMVNLNTATAAALKENLKGIGDKKAQAIVAYRKEHGAFKTLDEIKEVKGIGDGIFKKIKGDISLTKGATDLIDKAPAGTSGKSAEKKSSLKGDKAAGEATSIQKETQKNSKTIKPAGNSQKS